MSLAFVRLLAVGLLVAAGSSPAAAQSPPEPQVAPEDPFAAYVRPSLGAAVAVRDATVAIGHLRLALKDGSAAPLLAGDDRVGLFFVGTAGLVYESENPEESPVLSHNAKHTSGLTIEPTDLGVRLKGGVDRVLVLGSPELLPVVDGQPSESLDADLQKHLGFFENDRSSPAAHFLLKHRLDRPDATVLRVEIAGPAGELCYLYDPIDRRSEILNSYRRFHGSRPAGARWPVILSEQTIDRDPRAFKGPLFLLTDVEYVLTADGKENAVLSVEETVVPFQGGQRVFRFDLINEFFDNLGKSREWRLKSVRHENGRPVAFHHERDELVVVLAEPARVKTPFRLRFEIEGRILYQPANDAYWMLGVMPWLPLPELAGQFFTVHSTIKVAQPFVPIAPGTTVDRRVEGEFNVVENRIEKPVQFIVALAGKYKFEEETKGDLTVRVASYARPKKGAAAKLTNLAMKTIEYYETFLGPFPFREYNVVEINELGWGQAPPGMMFITKEAFTPWFNQVWSKGINHRFAHEIAHQYWGHVVKMGSPEEQWITEAFSEYCSGFVVRQVRGKDGYRDLVEEWQANAELAHEKSPITLANRLFLATDNGFYDRVYLIYDKGALFLAALHDEAGDAAFASFLRSYQNSLAWKFGATDLMPQLLEMITGEDYKDRFEDCVWGTRMPRTPEVLTQK